MQIIKNNQTIKVSNSNKCKTIEYIFHTKEIDLGIAIISGRYPENGFCMNRKCKELIYVLEGNGRIYFENDFIEFEKGDAILIEPKEKYYWNSAYCKISLSCTPAWSKEQYELIP